MDRGAALRRPFTSASEMLCCALRGLEEVARGGFVEFLEGWSKLPASGTSTLPNPPEADDPTRVRVCGSKEQTERPQHGPSGRSCSHDTTPH